MSTRHIRERRIKTGRSRKARPKTFNTEEAAKKYAEEKGIKEYTLKNLKCDTASSKKIKIVF